MRERESIFVCKSFVQAGEMCTNPCTKINWTLSNEVKYFSALTPMTLKFNAKASEIIRNSICNRVQKHSPKTKTCVAIISQGLRKILCDLLLNDSRRVNDFATTARLNKKSLDLNQKLAVNVVLYEKISWFLHLLRSWMSCVLEFDKEAITTTAFFRAFDCCLKVHIYLSSCEWSSFVNNVNWKSIFGLPQILVHSLDWININ